MVENLNFFPDLRTLFRWRQKLSRSEIRNDGAEGRACDHLETF